MLTIVQLFILWPAIASADVMSPEHQESLRAPTDCAPGSAPVAGSHGDTGRSPYCRPTTCTTDADCPNDTGPCRELGLCIDTRPTYGPPTPSGEPDTYELAHSACAGAACETGTCQTALRCAGSAPPPADPPEHSTPESTAPATRGCSCDAGATSGVSFALVACGLALLVRRRFS